MEPKVPPDNGNNLTLSCACLHILGHECCSSATPFLSDSRYKNCLTARVLASFPRTLRDQWKRTKPGDRPMKKVLLSTVALIAFAAPAAAADLAARPYVKAPPAPIAVVYDWSGFYIGANGGWCQSHNCVDFITLAGTVASGCRDRSGGVVGGQIGYRWQASQFVFGLEAQGDWADFSNSRVSLFDPTLSTRV